MKKNTAINIVNNQLGKEELKNSNTNFANINTSKNVWWINPAQEKFSDDLYFILKEGSELILLEIPSHSIKQLDQQFRIRKDNGRVDLELSCDKHYKYLCDVKSGGTDFDFKPYIKIQIPIPKDLLVDTYGKRSQVNNKNTFQNKNDHKILPGQKIIESNETDISYQKLFGGYLKDAKRISIQDPYIRVSHQFFNLQEFCIMLSQVKNGQALDLEVITYYDEGNEEESIKNFKDLSQSVSELGINLSYRFQDIHDRFIVADNGWKIILGRGLDIFAREELRFSIAYKDQNKRKCKPCEITYLRA